MRILLVLLLMLQVAGGPRGSIEGIVTTAGTVLQRSLPNARLELREGPGTPIVARSDGNGRFVFSNLAPGRYRLFLTEHGFIRQEFGGPIVLAPGQSVKNVAFRLESAPTITGLLEDEYGYPVPNILAQAFKRSYDPRGKPTLALFASALSDDRGQYRIFWIDPGEYFAGAGPAPSPAASATFVPTYFPGVTDPEAAKSFRADIGREVRVDFRLRRQSFATISGYVTNAMTGRPAGAGITLTPIEDANVARYQSQSSAATGQFEIRGVAPGSYILTGRSISGEKLTGFTRIRVPSVREFVLNARLALSPDLQVHGSLIGGSETLPDIRGSQIVLTSVETGFPSPPKVSPRAGGQFSVTNVLPGEYLLSVSGLPDDVYVRAARYGASDALQTGITIRAEVPALLQILLSADGGSVNAAVFDRENRPASNAHVVLVPDNIRRHRPDQYRVTVSAEDGQATIRGIPPGRYKLFAWQRIEPNAYFNSDFLRAYEDFGRPLVIGAGQNAAISLRVISSD